MELKGGARHAQKINVIFFLRLSDKQKQTLENEAFSKKRDRLKLTS